MPVEIPEEISQYMYDFIDGIIKDIGPRMPCSEPEEKAAKVIKGELEKTCDAVKIEPFTCHPRAFLGWIQIVILMVIGSAACCLFLMPYIPIIAACLAFGVNLVALVIVWYEFFNYDEFIDRLFKEQSSQNVVGTIKPQGAVKKILIFSGHHDSALQFNLLRYLKHGYFVVIFLGLFVFFILVIVLGVNLIGTLFNLGLESILKSWIIRLLLIGSPAFVGLFLFVWPGKKANQVPGAIDNLSAVAIVLALGRYLQSHKDIIPKDTEIRLISFGCEEAGLRGAYRYVEAHLDELRSYDAVDINMDGVMSDKSCMIFENEPTTRTHHSKEIVNKLKKAAEIVEVPISAFGASILERFAGLLSGGTDAAAFSKSKVKAATLASMELRKFPLFYHQPSDTLDMITRGSLEMALKVCIGYVLNESKLEN